MADIRTLVQVNLPFRSNVIGIRAIPTMIYQKALVRCSNW